MLYDIAIIGGGPAGYTAAERAASKGLSVVLFEKSAIGGVCLNEGCIPTKTLLYSAKVLDNIHSSAKYGVEGASDVLVDLPKIIGRKNKTVRKLTAGIRMRLSGHDVVMALGEAFVEAKENDNFVVRCNEETYLSKKLLVCTGSETIVPPIEGLDRVDYWTSKEALNVKEIPKSLVIIGGGVIGIEFASFFNSIGTKVTVVEMMPEILGAMDKEVSAMLRAEYTKKGVSFRLETKVVGVSDNQVFVEQEGKADVIEADKILISVGRRPQAKGLGLDNLNIEMFKAGVKVNSFMQTSDPHVYACGDITGFSLLAHTAVREAEVAVNHILGIDDQMSYKAIPSVVYTNPEVAGVGQTEEELIALGKKYNIHKLPMAFSGRFVAENELGNGICKLITDEDHVIIGCHLLGNPASELIVIAGIAIEKRFTVEDFQKIVFPHPTVGEIIHESLFI